MDFLEFFFNHYNNWVSVALMVLGFYGALASSNLVKILMSLTIFQVSVLLIYISAANVDNGNIPILKEGVKLYINPIPHVLMLTAIVVGVAVMALGLAIVIRIKEEYGSIEEAEIIYQDNKLNSDMKDNDNR